jgi:hypothetical protein
MAEARVVDTNVLIVASSADESSPFQPDATPVQESELRQKVLDWLVDFEADAQRHAVLDWDWHICGEYRNNLTEQDYGWLALMGKKDRNEVVWVGLEMDADGHAVLNDELATAVTDLADRKMVAAALAAIEANMPTFLTNACDTDWLDCQAVLKKHGVELENLLFDDWLQARWHQKHNKENTKK